MKCFHCGQEHASSKCAALHEPLKDGFYSGGGGGHALDADEDKNGIRKLILHVHYPLKYTQTKCLTPTMSPIMMRRAT